MKEEKILKTQEEILKNMGRNTPGGNFLGRNFPEGNSPGGV